MLSTLVPHSASNTTRSIGREVLTALPTFSPHQIVGLRGRKLSSARKSAEQRALVCLISQTGYLMTEKFVLEFKKIDQEDDNSPQDALQSALQQIRDKEYAAELGRRLAFGQSPASASWWMVNGCGGISGVVNIQRSTTPQIEMKFHPAAASSGIPQRKSTSEKVLPRSSHSFRT